MVHTDERLQCLASSVQRPEDRGVDGAGGNSVHPDSVRGEVDRSRLDQPDHPMLGGRVGRTHRGRVEPVDRRCRDDRAATALSHRSCAGLHADEHTTEVDRDRAVELLERNVEEVPRRGDARIEERAIEAPEALDDGGDHGGVRLSVRHVGTDGQRVATVGLDGLGNVGGAVGIQVGDPDGGTLLREQPRGRRADARRATGDQNHLFIGHALSFRPGDFSRDQRAVENR